MGGKSHMRIVSRENLAEEMAKARQEMSAHRSPLPSEIPDLPSFDLSAERSDFGDRATSIERQLGLLEGNLRQIGAMLMNPKVAQNSMVLLDRKEELIFDYGTNVLPEDWVEERRLFFVKIIGLMVRFYPPFVWEETDDEVRAWICEVLKVDPGKVDLKDREMMRRLQCFDSARFSLARIGTMGVRVGVFQRSSKGDLPQQRIKIRAQMRAINPGWTPDSEYRRKKGNPLELVDLVCQYQGGAALTQPLRHMIAAMRSDARAVQRRDVTAIKEGCTTERFLDALEQEEAVTWAHLEDETYDMPGGGKGKRPGGFIRLQIKDGWVYPVAAINWISRSRRWRALMEDNNKPRVRASSIGQKRFDQKGDPRLAKDTHANTRYWHDVLNRVYQAQKSAQRLSDEGAKRRDAASVSLKDWLHPDTLSVGTAFARREFFRSKRSVYKGVEVVLERREDGEVCVVWHNEASGSLFKGATSFRSEEGHAKAFRVFLDTLHRDLGLPDVE